MVTLLEELWVEVDPASYPSPAPLLAGPRSSYRWLVFEAKGPRIQRGKPERQVQIYCQVCSLVCSEEFPDNYDNKGYVQGSFPYLMLCSRHYKLMKRLVDSTVPLDRWPTQLLRGLVYHYYELELDVRNRANNARSGVILSQQDIANTPTTEKRMVPLPMMGMGWSPLGGPASMTNYGFFMPGVREVPVQGAAEKIAADRDRIRNLSDMASMYDAEAMRLDGEVQRYLHLIMDSVKRSGSRFKSCLWCHQSEIPLKAKHCPYCGKAEAVMNKQVAEPVLVEEADPIDAIPDYMFKDLFSAGPSEFMTRDATPEELKAMADTAGDLRSIIAEANAHPEPSVEEVVANAKPYVEGGKTFYLKCDECGNTDPDKSDENGCKVCAVGQAGGYMRQFANKEHLKQQLVMEKQLGPEVISALMPALKEEVGDKVSGRVVSRLGFDAEQNIEIRQWAEDINLPGRLLVNLFPYESGDFHRYEVGKQIVDSAFSDPDFPLRALQMAISLYVGARINYGLQADALRKSAQGAFLLVNSESVALAKEAMENAKKELPRQMHFTIFLNNLLAQYGKASSANILGIVKKRFEGLSNFERMEWTSVYDKFRTADPELPAQKDVDEIDRLSYDRWHVNEVIPEPDDFSDKTKVAQVDRKRKKEEDEIEAKLQKLAPVGSKAEKVVRARNGALEVWTSIVNEQEEKDRRIFTVEDWKHVWDCLMASPQWKKYEFPDGPSPYEALLGKYLGIVPGNEVVRSDAHSTAPSSKRSITESGLEMQQPSTAATPPVPAITTENSVNSDNVRFCPMCGAEQKKPKARFCFSCGTSLEGLV